MALQTGIFSDLLSEERIRIASEKRSSLENPSSPLSYPAEWLLDMWQGGRTDSGIRVSELTALQASTFLSCVDLISGTIASLPKHVYQRSLNSAGRAIHTVSYDHDLYDLIHNEPNDEMSSHTLTKSLMAHALAWGNSYCEIQRDASNRAVAIWPRNPAKTRPIRLRVSVHLEPQPWRPFPVNLPAGTMAYRTTDGIDDEEGTENHAQPERIIPKEDMLHIPGLALDGRLGQSVVWLARQTIGLALATEKFGAKYFANFARPGGILTPPGSISQESLDIARKSWMEAQGGENSHRVAVLKGGDWKFTPITNNPEQSQTIQTQQFIRNEICSLVHVSPHMVGDVDKGRANTEQLAQEFIQYAIYPWLSVIKQEYKRKLFPHTGIGRTPRNNFYVDFDLSDMLRPDAASREKFYSTGRQWGFLNANDCRAMEKLNPIDDPSAEQYWIPVNMTLSTTPINPNIHDGSGKGGKPEAKQPGNEEQKSLFLAQFRRCVEQEHRDSSDIFGHLGVVLCLMAASFVQESTAELRLSGEFSLDRVRQFMQDYCDGMEKRAGEWTMESADAEFARASTALRINVYREAATAKAKEIACLQ